MKKSIMLAIGVALFIAGCQHTRRQVEYVSAQSALTNEPAYAAIPMPTPTTVVPPDL